MRLSRGLGKGLLALCGMVLAGCAVTQSQRTPVGYRLLHDANTGANYYLYVPSTYAPDRPAPLIVSCHGTPPYDTAERQVMEWRLIAEQYGFLLVCPVLVGTDGLLGSGPVGDMLQCERRIFSVVNQLQYTYRLDRRNVLLTGFSGGSFPVFFAGLRHPDMFTAVVSRSGNFNAGSIRDWYAPAARQTPVMVFWGQNDPGAIRSQSHRAVEFLREAGFTRVASEVVPGSGHERHPEVALEFWLQHWNGPLPIRRTPRR